MSNKLQVGKSYIYGWRGLFGKYHEEIGVLTDIQGARVLVFNDNLYLDYYKDIIWISSIDNDAKFILKEIPIPQEHSNNRSQIGTKI